MLSRPVKKVRGIEVLTVLEQSSPLAKMGSVTRNSLKFGRARFSQARRKAPSRSMLVGDGCSRQALRWTESTEHLAFIMRSTSKSDKARAHSYEYLYHRQLGPIAHRACDCLNNNSNNQARAARSTSECKPIRFLEIGLGCGMPWGAGASVEMWHNLFRPPLKLDLHILELDRPCSEKWTAAHRTRATVHVGSQSSPADLDRLYNASGASPFDVWPTMGRTDRKTSL